MDRLYTAEARAYGARTGAVVSSDDRLDLQLSRPSEIGGDGGPETNPEQLFAAGYAACFHSAMRFAVKDVGLSPVLWRARTSPRASTSSRNPR
jgi:lipoyl-dependent peroxiredoxin